MTQSKPENNKVAIMQPTYLPWAGYFNMMNYADIFVMLDDVQFNKRSWQQRNKILFQGAEKILTISVKSKGLANQKILDVEIADYRDLSRHFEQIKSSYKNSFFFYQISDGLKSIYNSRFEKLIDLNIALINFFKEILEIKTKIIFASNLNITGSKSQLMLNILNSINTGTFLSAPGSRKYIEDEGILQNQGFKINYFEQTPIEYKQFNSSVFLPYLSIIDLIANVGIDSARKDFYMKYKETNLL